MSPMSPDAGKAYWRSLEDLADAPEFRRFVENEFPEFAHEMRTPHTRRGFLKLMGASVALAGMASCRWPVEEIVPFAHRPEGVTPGVPRRYASAMELSGVATGVLVTSYDGRPVKIEGNPNHPYSMGASSAWAQAAILELYDPDRSREVRRLGDGEVAASSWADFDAFAAEHFRGLLRDGGRGLRVLAEPSCSPGLEMLRGRFHEAFPEARWVEWEPFSRTHEREGAELALGAPHRTHVDLEGAEVVVALDADLFLTHPSALRHAREFAMGRRSRDGRMNRLYAVEACHTLTGSLADHRLPVRPGEVGTVLGRVAAELFLHMDLALPEGIADLRGLDRFLDRSPSSAIELAMVRDLLAYRGRSAIVVGSGQSAEVHAAVHLLNAALGNVGRTVRYTGDPAGGSVEALTDLADDLADGRVRTLVVLGGNPVFDAPADLDMGRLVGSVETSLRLGIYEDETSQSCRWHLPRAHWLESWGDARAWDGTVSVVQPLIEPLWGGRTSAELLTRILGAPRSSHDVAREAFGSNGGEDAGQEAWRRALHDGIVEGSAWPEVAPRVRGGDWFERLARDEASRPEGSLELQFRLDASVHDGRFANNGWLQEMPDPMTKLTWDSAVLVAPSDAASSGLSQGDVVRVRHDDREVELPVYVMPGQAAGSVSVFPGYGRRRCGSVGDGVGADVYALRTAATPDRAWCTLERTGRRYPLACTQDHWAIDALGAAERASRVPVLVREVEHRDWLRDPEHAVHGGHHGEHVALWKEREYDGHRWAMSVDLNACVGCGACTVACQAENNIPVVGKHEVARGHEMHWIRIDRYFSGNPDAPSVSHQPVTCQHCENAPCEQVCPVAATVHDSEGLNVMVYNRCIGTRYCSNNCPYKVRRFNWFNFNKHIPDERAMGFNPEVTVRARGVMEKCTFCVQRINQIKIEAKNERRPIRDGEITPACAQACPAQAIEFGDLNDPASRVRELHRSPRSYAMLEEQNVQPRLRYMARLRNRVPEGVRSRRDG